jgi:hypothetical protein
MHRWDRWREENKMSTPVSVSFTFQAPSGDPLAGGRVEIRLSSDIATAVSNGVQVAAKRTVTATLDAAGSTTVSLWPNATLLPAGTVYFLVAYSASGQPAWRGEIVVDSATGNYLVLEDSDQILLEDGTSSILLEI